MKICLLLFILLILNSCTDNKNHSLVVAKINSEVLTAKNFADLLIKKIHNYSSMDLKSEKNLDRIKAKILNDFILNSISTHWAKENNIIVTTKEVQIETQKIRKSYPDEVYFRKTLINEKITYNDWVKNVRKSLLTRKISDSLFKKHPSFTQKTLKTYYSQNRRSFKKPAQIRLQQIVVEKQIEAEQILKKLYRKHSFSSLAKVHSITPEASSGGHLGWVRRGVNSIFDKAFYMGVGRTSQILKSPHGFHIIKLLGKKSSKTTAFPQARKKIVKILVEMSKEKIYKKWLGEQIKKFVVFKNTNLIKSISVSTRGEP